MSRLGKLYAWLAFVRTAAIYDLLTDHSAWREDCRALGALVPGPRVLDLGVGPGAGALAMAVAHPDRIHVGIDVSSRMLRRAGARAAAAGVPLSLVRGDAARLPLRDAALDGATGHSILYLLPDAAAALREVRRALRSGGRVAFVEPRRSGTDLRVAFHAGVHHGVAMAIWRSMSRLHRRFDEAELGALFAAGGFADVSVRPVLSGFGLLATATRP